MKQQRWEESEKSKEKKEDQRRERVRRKKIKVLEKVEKSRNCVFPILCGSGGSKSRLAKAAGAEPSGQTRDPKLHGAVAGSRFGKNTSCSEHFWKLEMSKVHAMWREARVEVKARKAHQCRSTFGSSAVEQVLQCCGAKHVWKRTCLKHCRIRSAFVTWAA